MDGTKLVVRYPETAGRTRRRMLPAIASSGPCDAGKIVFEVDGDLIIGCRPGTSEHIHLTNPAPDHTAHGRHQRSRKLRRADGAARRYCHGCAMTQRNPTRRRHRGGLCAIAAGAYLWQRSPLPAGAPARAAAPAPAKSAASTYVGEPACTPCHEAQTKEWRQSRSRPRDGSRERRHGARRLQQRLVHLRGHHVDVLEAGRQVLRAHRRPGRRAARLRDRLHVRLSRRCSSTWSRFPAAATSACPSRGTRRPKEQGGQRWFHLYPAERITSGDPLHWTGPNQNWNYMCADCHSTNLGPQLRPRHEQLQDDVVRDQRVVRDLPRARARRT